MVELVRHLLGLLEEEVLQSIHLDGLVLDPPRVVEHVLVIQAAPLHGCGVLRSHSYFPTLHNQILFEIGSQIGAAVWIASTNTISTHITARSGVTSPVN